jgi:hypothetical protein
MGKRKKMRSVSKSASNVPAKGANYCRVRATTPNHRPDQPVSCTNCSNCHQLTVQHLFLFQRMRADINIIAGLLALAIISGSSGFHVHGRVPSPLGRSSARQVRNRPEVISEAILSRGGQAGIALGSTLEGLGKSRALKSLSRVLTSIVDPAISGGLLSGGLHAITGTYVCYCMYCTVFRTNALTPFSLQRQDLTIWLR